MLRKIQQGHFWKSSTRCKTERGKFTNSKFHTDTSTPQSTPRILLLLETVSWLREKAYERPTVGKGKKGEGKTTQG